MVHLPVSPALYVAWMALSLTAFRVDTDVVAELDAIAAAANVTRSDLLRTAVADLVANPTRHLAALDAANQDVAARGRQ